MIVGINGSPRKHWNTYRMVDSALKGAGDAGAETKLHNLYDLAYKGCTSCFACLRLGGTSHGKCAMRDDLTQVLDDILAADAVIVGSPVYFGNVSSGVQALCERLWYAGLAYDDTHQVLYTRRIPVKIILVTGIPEEHHHQELNKSLVDTMSWIVGPTELIESNGVWQFDDYSKYDAAMFDVEERKKRRDEVFPLDLKRAYEMGQRAVEESKAPRSL